MAQEELFERGRRDGEAAHVERGERGQDAHDPVAVDGEADPAVVGDEHYRVAQEVIRILQRYKDLQDIIAILGIDELSGGSFYADPLGWVLDDTVPVTNPNVITFGKPGGGKSTNTKNFATLMMDFGYKVFVLGDPKDEYEPLCRAFGVQPFAVGPGMSARINPLDFGPLGNG